MSKYKVKKCKVCGEYVDLCSYCNKKLPKVFYCLTWFDGEYDRTEHYCSKKCNYNAWAGKKTTHKWEKVIDSAIVTEGTITFPIGRGESKEDIRWITKTR